MHVVYPRVHTVVTMHVVNPSMYTLVNMHVVNPSMYTIVSMHVVNLSVYPVVNMYTIPDFICIAILAPTRLPGSIIVSHCHVWTPTIYLLAVLDHCVNQ